MNQHIIILSYSFPPMNRISCRRPLFAALLFTRLGCKTTVITPRKSYLDRPFTNAYSSITKSSRFTQIEPWSLVWLLSRHKISARSLSEVTLDTLLPRKKVLTHKWFPGFQTFLKSELKKIFGNFLSPSTFSIPLITFSLLREILSSQSAPYVISTYGPPMGHVSCLLLKVLGLEFVWIADYRDPWYPNLDTNTNSFLRLLVRKIDSLCALRADYVLVVSNQMKFLYQTVTTKPILVVPNGYDTRISTGSNTLKFTNGSNMLKLVYTGTLNRQRSPKTLLMAINKYLNNKGHDMDICFDVFGAMSDEVSNDFINISNKEYVTYHGLVDPSMARKAQINADFLVLIESGSSNMTGKVYEYISLLKPIIAINTDPNSELGLFLRTTGLLVGTASSESDIFELLQNLDGFNASPNYEFIKNYHRRRVMLDAIRNIKRLESQKTNLASIKEPLKTR